MALPDGLRRSMAHVDGAIWNGLMLYAGGPGPSGEVGAGDLVDINFQRRRFRPLRSLLVIGEWDDDWLVYDARADDYFIADRVTLDVFGRFADHEEMVAAAMAEREVEACQP